MAQQRKFEFIKKRDRNQDDMSNHKLRADSYRKHIQVIAHDLGIFESGFEEPSHIIMLIRSEISRLQNQENK